MSEEQIIALLSEVSTLILAFALGGMISVVVGILVFRSSLERSFLRKFYESQGLKYRG